MNIIETQNLSHRYWRTEALRDLTLAVPEGRAFLACLWRASRLAQGAFPVQAQAPFEVRVR